MWDKVQRGAFMTCKRMFTRRKHAAASPGRFQLFTRRIHGAVPNPSERGGLSLIFSVSISGAVLPQTSLNPLTSPSIMARQRTSCNGS